ncbi:uncharacterized protein P884DRAFT_327361 [Thermothelomyces heterothallicus CBS 202.75]|uniref:uncharacterized protein n=1 Tax=Thermothelomyces heterothallicus CBS 202.75 TaxID=1149848 RepID=UPI003743D11F
MPMHNGFLPREGFKGDTVLQIIGNTALNPELLLPLKLLAFGLLRRINGWFSRKVLDNWVDDRYDWSKEIVVVTGGSGGIGGQIVQLLAERRIEPTVLVNNAGVVQGRTVLEASERDVRSTFDVNTPAHYRTTKEFLPAMLATRYGAPRGRKVVEDLDKFYEDKEEREAADPSPPEDGTAGPGASTVLIEK